MTFQRTQLSLLIGSLLFLSGGCVALNIPSQRLHDPGDSGGVLGHWRGAGSVTGSHVANANAEGQIVESGHVAESTQVGPVVSDGCGSASLGGCGCSDCLDWEEEQVREKPPEVPWPRFHPVPTRPVFASPAVDELGYR